MKSHHLLSVVTLLIGFSIAWVLKPAPPASEETVATPEGKSSQRHSTQDVDRTSSDRSASSSNSSSTELAVDPSSQFPLSELLAKGPLGEREAKMRRLAEELGLSFDQEADLMRLLDEVQAIHDPNLSPFDDLMARSEALEKGLKKLLSPEQLANFEKMRERAFENLVETRAMQRLTPTIESVDLSSEQRAQLHDRLRMHARNELQVFPKQSLSLIGSSVLPLRTSEITVDGFFTMKEMSRSSGTMDPQVAQDDSFRRHQAEKEALLKCFEGVLTPAQIGIVYGEIERGNNLLRQIIPNPSNLQKSDSLARP
ncbi:MAG: hypothetical protein EAZ42_01325 [Verrucomicrobia bacterium]|nr:MAG: hypothetical protein EAZ42_01325 [Verrucomicrobiota bacterium]